MTPWKNCYWKGSSKVDLEQEAIEILHIICGKNHKAVIGDSGGKDSSVLKHIALKANQKYGFKFKIRHNHTTVDAPETVYFVREEQKRFQKIGINYEILMPKETMWQLIVRYCTPPTRLIRYCCADLKENTGDIGERLVTGVRKAESINRKKNQGMITIPKPKKKIKTKAESDNNFLLNEKGGLIVLNLDNSDTRQIVEDCFRTHKVLINPLAEWEDDFLWWYIRHENIRLNPRYEKKGICRVGCIGCPMAGEARWAEFGEFPTYKAAYIKTFDKMLKERERRGLKNGPLWKDGLHVFKWWMEDKNIDGQLAFGEDMKIYEMYTDYINYV